MPLAPPPSSPLVDYLKRSNPGFYGKLSELRAEIKQWLTYIPQTFGHYTSHTIDHSDEIIAQISKLIFEPKKKRPIVDIGPVAAYILAAGAYLHDAGMVTADEEKAKILKSDEWKEWVGEGGSASKWKEIEKLRGEAGGEALKHFAVDRATRLLVAEFIRRQHHRRAGEFVRSRALELGRIDVGDPILRKAIADICVAHGLSLMELEDDTRFPEATDIQGERVNLRLLATLLRLGDLLDLRTNRACPLLLQAACPLPADSIAHWTQYQAIESRLTSPRKIEIYAKCQNQEEHRVLADWCAWIVREVERLQARLPTTEWKFPQATMAGKSPTIVIESADNANYIPARWTFELDQDAVFQRLIADVYNSPMVFLRELIQNALDAMRCRMYQDLKDAGKPLPPSPDQAPDDILENYKLQIGIREERVRSESTGDTENIYVLHIEDQGLGMDRDIIERYLLQVGRSYYTTADFRRSFPFPPTSRFGVGFLSVFSVSDHITVETYKPTSSRYDGPLRLKLTGPRSYILLERGRRTAPGTRIEVHLRAKPTSSLEDMVRDWCVLVEFPIEIDDFGVRKVVRRLQTNELNHEWTDPFKPSVRYVQKFHPIQHSGISGGFITISYIKGKEERWLSQDKLRELPIPLESLPDKILLHGIRISPVTYYSAKHMFKVIDWRTSKQVSMRRLAEDDIGGLDPDLVGHACRLVEAHVGPDNRPFNMKNWLYLAELFGRDMDFAGLPIWETRNDVVPIWNEGRIQTYSMRRLLSMQTWFFGLALQTEDRYRRRPPDIRHEALLSEMLKKEDVLLSAVFPMHTGYSAGSIWERVCEAFTLTDMRVLNGRVIAECTRRESPTGRVNSETVFIRKGSCGFDVAVFGDVYHGWLAVNTAKAFGAWYQNVYRERHSGKMNSELSALGDKIEFALRDSAAAYKRPSQELIGLLRAWNVEQALAKKLRWPGVEPSFPASPTKT